MTGRTGSVSFSAPMTDAGAEPHLHVGYLASHCWRNPDKILRMLLMVLEVHFTGRFIRMNLPVKCTLYYDQHTYNLMLHHHRHPLLCLRHCLCRILIILQFPGKVGIIRGHIEVSMSRQIKQDGL
jgi:hypothetical protein